MALGALFLQKPFIDFVFTEEHRAGVRAHLATTDFMGFFTDGSLFYDSHIAEELADAGIAKAPAAAAEVSRGKRKKESPPAPAAPAKNNKAAPRLQAQNV
eukprot:4248134-Lingulodinium_polyedra.AAC.1